MGFEGSVRSVIKAILTYGDGLATACGSNCLGVQDALWLWISAPGDRKWSRKYVAYGFVDVTVSLLQLCPPLPHPVVVSDAAGKTFRWNTHIRDTVVILVSIHCSLRYSELSFCSAETHCHVCRSPTLAWP